ncbi:MAG: hypothetical protein QME45_04350 [Clostridiales bacterium]|nr:hypothetical protein [Clostridiales bacterium]
MNDIKGNIDLNGAANKIKAALKLYADTAAKKLEAEAKSNAPWTDRTGHARQGLNGSSGWDANKLKVVLSGGMEYSVYLELAHEKKYAILEPTIQKNAKAILEGYQKLVKD